MSMTDIFYSPELKPYRELRRKNGGAMAIAVEMKRNRTEAPFRTALVARSSGELARTIKELHRIQVIMCVRFSETGRPADTSRCYLAYEPLDWRFSADNGTITNLDTGETLPLSETIEL